MQGLVMKVWSFPFHEGHILEDFFETKEEPQMTVKKNKTEAHRRLALVIAPAYLNEIRRVFDDVKLDAIGKAKAIYKLETDMWDLLG